MEVDPQFKYWVRFLKDAGLDRSVCVQYAQSFSENDIKLKHISQANAKQQEEDSSFCIKFLKELGVTKLGHYMPIIEQAMEVMASQPQSEIDVVKFDDEVTVANDTTTGVDIPASVDNHQPCHHAPGQHCLDCFFPNCNKHLNSKSLVRHVHKVHKHKTNPAGKRKNSQSSTLTTPVTLPSCSDCVPPPPKLARCNPSTEADQVTVVVQSQSEQTSGLESYIIPISASDCLFTSQASSAQQESPVGSEVLPVSHNATQKSSKPVDADLLPTAIMYNNNSPSNSLAQLDPSHTESTELRQILDVAVQSVLNSFKTSPPVPDSSGFLASCTSVKPRLEPLDTTKFSKLSGPISTSLPPTTIQPNSHTTIMNTNIPMVHIVRLSTSSLTIPAPGNNASINSAAALPVIKSSWSCKWSSDDPGLSSVSMSDRDSRATNREGLSHTQSSLITRPACRMVIQCAEAEETIEDLRKRDRGRGRPRKIVSGDRQ